MRRNRIALALLGLIIAAATLTGCAPQRDAQDANDFTAKCVALGGKIEWQSTFNQCVFISVDHLQVKEEN